MPNLIPDTVDVTQLSELMRSEIDLALVDVRSQREFRRSHIADSINVPLATLPARGADLFAAYELVVLICASGQRAELARQALARVGAGRVTVLEGGIEAWQFGTPAGRRGWSMERQVRLVAGSVVLAGVLGSLLYDPLKWLAGAIGLGLTIAGLTNTCGLARVLGLLPYNRRSSASR